MTSVSSDANSAAKPGSKGYYAQDRRELLDFLTSHWTPRGRALDVGCGEGVTGAALLGRGVDQVFGIEPIADAAHAAEARLTGVFNGLFPQLPAEWGKQPFDLIVMADVLEHMPDPWAGITAARELLAKEGVLLVSVPNVSHYSVLAQLFRGRWDYAASGILDGTHLRFFTPVTIAEAVTNAGLRVISTHMVNKPMRRRHFAIELLARRFAPHTLVFQQYLLCGSGHL